MPYWNEQENINDFRSLLGFGKNHDKTIRFASYRGIKHTLGVIVSIVAQGVIARDKLKTVRLDILLGEVGFNPV